MNIEREKSVLSIRDPKGTIEILPHPEEVIEVDPVILANMEARITGKSLSSVFGDEDKVSNELLLRQEIGKLKRVFGTSCEVNSRYRSIRSIKEVRDELEYEQINTDFLNVYSLKKTNGSFVDECDLFVSLLGGDGCLRCKNERFGSKLTDLAPDDRLYKLMVALQEHYYSENLEPIKITKEVIQLEAFVLALINSGSAVTTMNDLLSYFYGGAL